MVGVPVVSTDVGGVRDVVVDGETGILVPSGDVEAFAAAIREFLGDREKMLSFGKNAQEIACKKYDVSRLIAEIEKLYIDLTNEVKE